MQISGHYLYARDGKVVVREPWTASLDQDGCWRARCVRDATLYGVYLTLDAVRPRKGVWQFDLALQAQADGAIQKTAHYRIDGGVVSVFDPAHDTAQVLEPHGAFLFPLMRLFTGNMVRAISRHGGAHPVIVPSLVNLTDTQTVFEPLHSIRTGSQTTSDGRCFTLSGGAYEEPVEVTLRADRLLDHYHFTDAKGAVWRCWLDGFTSSSAP